MPNRPLGFDVVARGHHEPKDAPATAPAGGDADTNPSTSTRVQRSRDPKALSPERLDAGVRTSRMLSRCASHSCHQAGIERALDVSAETVSKWCDPDEKAAMTVRDVYASPRSFRRAVGQALLESADDNAPGQSLETDEHLLALGEKLGAAMHELREAKRDGVKTPDERNRIAAKLREVVEQANAALRDEERAR